MKSILSFILAILLNFQTGIFGQALPPNNDGTVYSGFENIIKANKPIQHIATGPFRDNGNGDWLIFEGLLAPQFIIYRGRDANPDWVQRGMITFIPAIKLRMFNEESFPVRPPNFNPYLVFYYLLGDTEEVSKNGFTYGEFQLAHYSNGQSGDFLNAGGDINLDNGNFSTNYYKLGITRAQYLKRSSSLLLDSTLISLSVLYRNDWELKNSPFTIEDGLRGNYALQRLNFITQLRTKNISQGTYRYNNGTYYRQFSYLLRIIQTYRLGGMSEINGRNRRYSLEVFTAVYPANWRMFGLMARYYFGRDYYNIRFDRKVSLFQVGFMVEFDKFKPRNYKVIGN